MVSNISGWFYIISVLELTIHSLSENQIATLDGFVIPSGLRTLELVFVLIVLELTTPSLSENQITTLDGVDFPTGLQIL